MYVCMCIYVYLHTHMYVHIYIYIYYVYIYIYIYLVRHGNVLMVFYGFHRRESRGPVAAGNH